MTISSRADQDRLLTVEAAADRMSTSVRFVRRLVAERRIGFVKLGRHVRISESDLAAFIAAGRVSVLRAPDVSPYGRRRSA
jgi:excisionase family DNA binding protein